MLAARDVATETARSPGRNTRTLTLSSISTPLRMSEVFGPNQLPRFVILEVEVVPPLRINAEGVALGLGFGLIGFRA